MKTAKTSRVRTGRSPFDSYLSEINDTPLLSVGEERELAARVALGDSAARDRMVRANLRLVVNLARRYTGRGLPLEDLIAEGNMGLLRAVEGYDAGMNTRFSTYAAYWVKQSIRRALCMTGRTVRLPAYVTTLLAQWRRTEAVLQEERGQTPDESDVAERMGLSRKQARIVRQALKVCDAGYLVDRQDGSGPVAEGVPDERVPEPGERMSGAEELNLAMGGLNRLDDRAAEVLKLRFGLDGQEPRTLQQIGERLGYTRERVRQIEREALARLRDYLQAA